MSIFRSSLHSEELEIIKMKAFFIGAVLMLSLVATIFCNDDDPNAEEYLECFGNKVRDDPAQFLQSCEGVDFGDTSNEDVSLVVA